MTEKTTTNETTAPARLVVGAHESDYNRRRGVLEVVARICSKELPNEYARLNVGDFDNAALADALFTDARQTREKYLTRVQEWAQTADPVQARLYEHAAEEWERGSYYFAVQRVKSTLRGVTAEDLRLLSVQDDGAVVLDDAGREALRTRCTEVLTSPEEIELRRKHEVLCEWLNDFFAGWLGVNNPRLPVWFTLFTIDRKTGKFTPTEFVNYAGLLPRTGTSEEAQTDGKQ